MKIRLLYILLPILILGSCRSTKYVADGEYLLYDYKIKTEGGDLGKEEINSYIKQKPNKTILGMRFHLGLYNLSRKGKENWINNSLRTIGEEPVLYDEFVKNKTTRQLELFLKNKGYYNALIEDTVIFRKKKAKIHYHIIANEPYRIRNLNYVIEDTALNQLAEEAKTNTLLNKGALLDSDLFAKEKNRIETLAKSKGFYYFTKDFIFVRGDSSLNSRQVDVELIFKKYQDVDSDGYIREKSHPIARIRNVYIHSNYNPKLALSDLNTYREQLDTLVNDSINILFTGEQNIKPAIVTESNYILPGNLYNNQDVSRTHRNMSALQTFRLVKINFLQTGEGNENGETLLDCEILLTPSTRQSFTAEVQGTNSSGNLGVAGNLIYRHKNLFRGAESFDLSFHGALETLVESYQEDFGNMVEIGSEVKINIPKFILPFKSDQFIKKYNPSTSISAAYNFQQRPDYTRTIAKAAFGYNWKGNRFLSHNIYPVEINLVKIPRKSQDFIDWLEDKYIYYSYQEHLITNTNYSLIYSNQNIRKNQDFFYMHLNLESAGNILAGSYDLLNIQPENDAYELFNTEFAQYIRGDIDLRFYNILNQNNSIVYRFFAGAGLPYNNSTALPFEKKYFSGGANSIRAWQVRNLGPGSYYEESTSAYPNKTADIKLEANLEYRFKLFWVLEGALFIDAGNIWAITSNDEREGALFEKDFYKDIAIGTGFGTRFDFNFFIFRLDLGVKARDPASQSSYKWIIGNRKMTIDDFTLNIGIGYPF